MRNRRAPTHRLRLHTLAISLTLALLAALVTFVHTAPTAHAAAFSVDNPNDVVDVTPGDGTCLDSDGLCSLRAAVMEANALGGTHTINVDRANSDPAQIPLAIPDTGVDSETTGDLDITADITITVGPRPEADIVPGLGFNDRAISVRPGGSLELDGINVRSFDTNEEGGGIYNEGTLTIGCGVHVEQNTGTNGGGIYNAGQLELAGARALRSNTATLGGNLYAAPNSNTDYRENPSCSVPLDLSGGRADRGGAVYAAADSQTVFEWDLGINDSVATISGGAFEVVDNADVMYNSGVFNISEVSAPTGSVAHVTNTARFAINPGPPNFSVNTRVASATVDPGAAHFHTESGDLDLVEVEIVNSSGDGVRSEGDSRLNATHLSIREGQPADDGIVLGDTTQAFVQTSYVDDRSTAIRAGANTRLDLGYSTLADNGTALDVDANADVFLDGSWLLRNGTNCTSGVDGLSNSAVTDTSCGTDASSMSAPTASASTTWKCPRCGVPTTTVRSLLSSHRPASPPGIWVIAIDPATTAGVNRGPWSIRRPRSDPPATPSTDRWWPM